ncbi:hypothetical protein OC845_000881 [Tilletia horrida]|nr:hypothetical protein OC845_000881 [Tilletia horrida]
MDPISQQLSRQHISDSRLLNSLYKAEKAYADHQAAAVAAALAASSALSSWGTSEPVDIATAAAEIADGLAQVANAQRVHVQAIEGYRTALKDVLDREQSIRSIVRDRDILVKRLIKADQKRAKAVGADPIKENERYQKHLFAQRELAACEDALQAEENALIGVKRRTFKEALTMRMKTMGDAGAAMVDAAKDAILLLDSFDIHGQMPIPPPLPDRPDDSIDGWQYGEKPYDVDGQDQQADPRFQNFNENASVTPSQSASQVNYGGAAQYSRPARQAESNFRDIGEVSNGHEPDESFEQARETADDEVGSDDESEQEFQQAFASQSHNTHTNERPPLQTQNSLPPPPPPQKEEPQQPLASLPPPPRAPTLNTAGGPDLGPIPTASRVYLRGEDSSSDDGAPASGARASGAGWTSHIGTNSHRRQESGDSRADGASPARPSGASRSGSFFGRVGRLFKTDLKSNPIPTSSPSKASIHDSSDAPARAETPSVSGAGAGAGSHRRKVSLLRSMAAPDSSDEEDPRDLVRHVNPRQPLWKAPGKASSDIGVKGKLESIPAPARITPGPMSARQLEEKRDTAPAQASARPVSMYETVASSAPKKKKKKASSTRRASSAFETGSEVGTAPTRAAGYAQGTSPTTVVKGDPSDPRGTLQRHSSVRSNMTGTGSTIGKKKKTRTGVSALNAFSTGETASKFSTATWVSRPGGSVVGSNAGNIAEAVANAGLTGPSPGPTTASAISGRATPTAPSTPQRKPSIRAKTETSASPALVPSASKNPPLKPALKHTSSMNRSNSQTTDLASAYQDLPKLGAPVKAPAPLSLSQETPGISLSPIPSAEAARVSSTSPTKSKPPALLKLAPHEGFDGTGRLGVPGTSPVPSPSREKAEADAKTQDSSTRKRDSKFQKIEMPKAEPFRFDLNNLGGSGGGGEKAKEASAAPVKHVALAEPDARTPASEREFLTPTEQEAYHLFLASPENPDVNVKLAPPKQPAATESGSTTPQAQETTDEGGVTRITARRTHLTPSRTYSSQPAPAISEDSEEASSTDGTEIAQEGGGVPSIPPVSFADSLHDDVQAAGTNSYLSDPALRSLQPPTLANVAKSDTSESGVSRRKSVRMAPDVKLPPETPTSDLAETPRGHAANGGKEFPFTVSEPPKPMRIAPPPAAPARVSQKEEGPIDLGGRERASWTTRIGAANQDSSSDEDVDGYASARKAFRSATRHLGEATGTSKPKSKSSPSKKKKKAVNEQGFSVDVVGRSPSTRR